MRDFFGHSIFVWRKHLWCGGIHRHIYASDKAFQANQRCRRKKKICTVVIGQSDHSWTRAQWHDARPKLENFETNANMAHRSHCGANTVFKIFVIFFFCVLPILHQDFICRSTQALKMSSEIHSRNGRFEKKELVKLKCMLHVCACVK